MRPFSEKNRLYRVAEFRHLERSNAESKKEKMGMQKPIYIASKKRAIELALPWQSATVQIAQRNHFGKDCQNL